MLSRRRRRASRTRHAALAHSRRPRRDGVVSARPRGPDAGVACATRSPSARALSSARGLVADASSARRCSPRSLPARGHIVTARAASTPDALGSRGLSRYTPAHCMTASSFRSIVRAAPPDAREAFRSMSRAREVGHRLRRWRSIHPRGSCGARPRRAPEATGVGVPVTARRGPRAATPDLPLSRVLVTGARKRNISSTASGRQDRRTPARARCRRAPRPFHLTPWDSASARVGASGSSYRPLPP